MTGNGSAFKSHRLSFVVVVDGGGGGGDGVVITGVEVAGVDPQKSSMSDGVVVAVVGAGDDADCSTAFVDDSCVGVEVGFDVPFDFSAFVNCSKATSKSSFNASTLAAAARSVLTAQN